MKEKLVIWGASGHATVIAHIIRMRGDEYRIVGFLDDVNPETHGTEFCGAPILGGREQLDILAQAGVRHLMLGFGNCEARLDLSDLVRAKGYSLASAIHPSAIIADGVSVGAGTVIVAGGIVNPGARIGENVIINTNSSVGHHCIVEDGVHIGPGVALGGGTVVGRGSWVGIGATVKDKVRIGQHSVIGAGAVVVNDIPDGVMAYGVPAKIIQGVERE